jgi:holo-[acyl-carrier protein] synthase
MVVGIGTDIVEVGRITSVLGRRGDRFRARVFTPEEQRYCEARADPGQHYAARFAAKEACMKALGTGWRGGVRWRDMEIVNRPSGQPELRLSGAAAERAASLGCERFHLTLAHDGGQALAVVILEGLDS